MSKPFIFYRFYYIEKTDSYHIEKIGLYYKKGVIKAAVDIPKVKLGCV